MATLHLELVGAIARGQALVVAGAGLSIAASGGRPEASWPGLLRSGLQHLKNVSSAADWAADEAERLSKGRSDALSLSFVATNFANG